MSRRSFVSGISVSVASVSNRTLATENNRAAAGQLGQSLFQFLAVVIGTRFFNLAAQFVTARFDIGFLAAADDGGVIFISFTLSRLLFRRCSMLADRLERLFNIVRR